MLSPTTRPVLSERLHVAPGTGLLSLNPALGTCYPVDGLRTYGPALHLDDVHFRTDPVALTASAAPDEPAPAPDLAAEAARAEAGMGWLLTGLLALLALTCLL